MDAASREDRTAGLSAFLAGLQAGMLGVCLMLVWLGLSAVWQQRSFWTAENLMASAFYGGSAIRRGFASETLSGMALYLSIYSLLGAIFAMAARDRVSQAGALMLGVVFGVAWYYLSFRLLWKSAMPLVSLLHAERPTLLGHLIYGIVLGRFPAYLGGTPPGVPPVLEEVPAAVTQSTENQIG